MGCAGLTLTPEYSEGTKSDVHFLFWKANLHVHWLLAPRGCHGFKPRKIGKPTKTGSMNAENGVHLTYLCPRVQGEKKKAESDRLISGFGIFL